MDSRNGTQVSWNYDGTLASAGSDSYVYDADGNETRRDHLRRNHLVPAR